MNFIYILLTVILSSYGQIIIKWRLSLYPPLPESIIYKALFLTKIIFSDFFVLSSFISAYIAGIFWMTALKNMELSIAYPFMSLSFVVVTLASALFFHERIQLITGVGLIFIIIGVSLIGYAAGRT